MSRWSVLMLLEHSLACLCTAASERICAPVFSQQEGYRHTVSQSCPTQQQCHVYKLGRALILGFCVQLGSQAYPTKPRATVDILPGCRSYLILKIAYRQLFGDGQAEDVREEDD